MASRRTLGLAALAWWFTYTFSHSGGVVGPFETREQCERIRAAFIQNHGGWGYGPSAKECVSDR